MLGPNLQLPAHVLISPNSFYETLNKGKLSPINYKHFSFWSGKHLLGFLSSCLVMIYEGRTEVLGSLSTRVFETRTATGSELFSLLTCPHTTTFTLLSILSPLEMNSIKIWETIRSKNANCSLPDAVRVSKTRVLKLPTLVIRD